MLRRPLQKLYPVECGTRQEEVSVTDAPVTPVMKQMRGNVPGAQLHAEQ